MSTFKVYSSSAGSGKTFTLTKEYLRLVLKQDRPSYFRRILAITFTNDAANEMKSRILEALRAFSDPNFDDSSPFWMLFRQVAQDLQQMDGLQLPDEELQTRSKAIFRQIIHEYADFSVRTIDSFVNKLVSAFTDDLGLPFNYEIVLDQKSVLLEAVERLYAKAGDNDHKGITYLLENFALDKADDGKSWNNMPTELADFGSHLMNDQDYPLVSKINALSTADFIQIKKQVADYLNSYRDRIVRLGKNATDAMNYEGVQIEDFNYGKSGIGAFFYKIQEDLDANVNSYHRKAIEEDTWYGKKTDAFTASKIDGIKEYLRECFLGIEEIRTNEGAKFRLLEQLLSSFYPLSLLKKIKEEFDQVLQENNQVSISEFNRKILEIVLTEPVPFIYERLGERFNHILIDEFQDTSDLQFYNLLPLIENSLAHNNFNLIVGDAKQSIYRWRGGKMELIVHLFNKNIGKLLDNPMISTFQIDQFFTLNQYLTPVSLATNYRSAVEIVDFNNRFFGLIKQNYEGEFPFLSESYIDFEQKTYPNAPLGGHVEIEFFGYENWQETTLLRIEEIINQAVASGYEWKDIAILSRKNKESAMVATYLNEKGIRVISQDSLLLKNSSVVRLTMAFLKVINQPDNKLAKYEAAYLFCQFRLKKIPDMRLNQQISEAVDANDVADFYAFFAQHGYHIEPFELQKAGVYATTEKIMQIMGFFDDMKELDYLFRLLDLALEFSGKKSNHLHDFLTYWETKKDGLAIANSSNTDALTVTSVHKSKGLEFPIVIIPFANWSDTPSSKSMTWFGLEDVHYAELSTTRNEKTKTLEAAPFKTTAKLLNTQLETQYKTELESTFIENLNTLYVAFTRATDQLFIMASKDFRNTTKGVAKHLETYLKSQGLATELPQKFVLNEGEFIKKTKKKKEELRFFMPQIISKDKGDRLRLRRTSEKIFDLETLEKTKDQGNKLHAAFALVRTKNDTTNALRQLIFEGVITTTEAAAIQESMEAVMALPELRFLFEEGLRVENEKEILQRNRDFSKRPDRVVFTDHGVYIIDYKTGQPQDSHKTQIRGYGKLFQEMGYAPVFLKLVYLNELRVVEVGG